MADINTWTFSGRLTKDAEAKVTNTGSDFVQFTVANNTGFGTKAQVLFVQVTLWGKAGMNLLPYLKKGKNVAVTGELKTNDWVSTQDGTNHRDLQVNSQKVILLNDGSGNSAMPLQDDDPISSHTNSVYSRKTEDDVTF